MICNFKFLLFSTFLFEDVFFQVKCHDCGYRYPNVSELVTGIKTVPLPPNVRIERSSSPNLRIYFDYQSSFTNSAYSLILQNTIMEPAKNILESRIIPKAPNTGLLLVDRNCLNGYIRINSNNIIGCAYDCTQTKCIDVVVPDKYLKVCTVVDANGNVQTSGTQGAGHSSADIVLLVTYTSCGGSTLAYAASCFMENTLNRPILGVVNLCSDYIIPGKNVKRDIKVVMHEIIHALGFAVDKYAFYRYENGEPIVPRNKFGLPNLGVSSGSYYNWNDKIIKTIVRQRESVSSQYSVTFYGFVLPNVLAAVRDHFNCHTLEAVDLEDYLSSGSTISHFDEYLLYNEIMTPQSNSGTDVLSKMTLALLQDTGWYKVDYSGLEDLDYGYKRGCLLPEGGCYKYMKSKPLSLDPFCNTPFGKGKTLGCSLFKNYFYYCDLQKMTSVPTKYQYFTTIPGVPINDVSYYSGLSAFNEYCPVYRIQPNPSFLCNDELSNGVLNSYNSIPSYFGPDSMCILNDIENPKSYHIYGASCQKYVSGTNSSEVTIYIGNSTFICPTKIQHKYTLSDGIVVLFNCPYDNIEPQTPVITNTVSSSSLKTNPVTTETVSKSSLKTIELGSFVLIIINLSGLFKLL